MDLLNNFMNIIVAPLALITLLLFLSSYLFIKCFLSILRTLLFSENVAGKVILITGASSGIGEHLAYEYARREASLALVARRENRLRNVAARAEIIGSPNAIVIPGDVTKFEDCQRFVDATINHFGRLDHLVANSGVASVVMFEDISNVTDMAPAMDINFWGSVYITYFAIPHLKRSKGKIVVTASAASWLPCPRLSFYSASKAAVVAMYETLRIELGSEIGVTIVTPGLIDSEMTQGKFLNKKGKLEVDQEMRDVLINVVPVESTETCAKAIVRSVCRGDKYLTEPAWCNAIYFWKVFLREIVEWFNDLFFIAGQGQPQRDTVSKRLLDLVRKIKSCPTPGIGTIDLPMRTTFPDDGSFLHHVD